MPANAQALAGVPLFSLLDTAACEALAARLEEEKVTAGTVIFAEGDPGDCMYLVRSGRVQITLQEPTGERIVLASVGPGEIFGELAIFDAGPRSAYATAVEDTQLLLLSRVDLELFLSQNPSSALHLLAVMANRVRETNDVVRRRVARNLNSEIAEELSWQLRTAGAIAQFSGSLAFLYLNAAFFTVWVVLNLGLIPGIEPFDPYPFGLLTMSVSLEAIFLSIIVLLSQNLQAAKDKIRGDIEYEVNIRAEIEVAQLHEKLDKMNARVLERLHRLEKRGLG